MAAVFMLGLIPAAARPEGPYSPPWFFIELPPALFTPELRGDKAGDDIIWSLPNTLLDSAVSPVENKDGLIILTLNQA
jgi:hypothetical protein